ncbi:excinuclease ABC subunit B [Flavobacterium sp. NST-5]|uniref:Excinuclease ABC subunit B n=1 Tax=Flavobacterium ichthyis TaxID=2698827 RepID=A0ABW9Z832_9FLAO|nr:excinuclease ABC subunit B [Flavobacterium ichthyis]NBL64346.1 excinuclease ABC subunit B [Flavobacterium ichthyis]
MPHHTEKLQLLADMIAFAMIDGELHPREYLFLKIVAQALNVSEIELNNLFREELPSAKPKNEFERVQHFYRMALLMKADGISHNQEQIAIQQLGINMGLDPFATKRLLNLMENNPQGTVTPDVLWSIFMEQKN